MTLGIKDILYPRMAKGKSLISPLGNAFLRMRAILRNRGELFSD
jgi:hypothetical protein